MAMRWNGTVIFERELVLSGFYDKATAEYLGTLTDKRLPLREAQMGSWEEDVLAEFSKNRQAIIKAVRRKGGDTGHLPTLRLEAARRTRKKTAPLSALDRNRDFKSAKDVEESWNPYEPESKDPPKFPPGPGEPGFVTGRPARARRRQQAARLKELEGLGII